MKQLAQAVAVFTDALCKVPGTQLQHIELTLRQLRDDLIDSGIGVLAELDDLIEDAAIAKAETMAELKDCIGPDDEDYYPSFYKQFV